ncbi:MAG: porin, partial [Burkholderiales bacterium]|nr:porin [Burkholderiales bacterium]
NYGFRATQHDCPTGVKSTTDYGYPKKSLVALAVLASCGAAMAQSSVNLYGRFDTGIEKLPGVSTRVSSGAGSSSRLGFRGVEDLGGGLQASFVVETSFESDKAGFLNSSGLAGIGNRATWLSIGSKDLGKFSLGRGYVGAFFTQLWADPTINSYGQRAAGTVIIYSTANQSRLDNVIRYETPNYMGLSADLGLGLRGDGGELRPAVDAGTAAGSPTRNISSKNTTGYTLHTQFRTREVYVGVSVAKIPDSRLAFSALGPAPITNMNVNGNVWTIAGYYDFGPIKISGAFENDRRFSSDKNAGHITLSAPVGNGLLVAWYGIDQNGGASNSALNPGGALTSNYKVASVSYMYDLSKRTHLYAAVNDDNVSGTFRNPATRKKITSQTAISDGISTQIGIRHDF